jgi:hypothetical protein
MLTTPLFLRTTHGYADGWQHLDHHQYLGLMRLTAPRVTEYGDGHENGPTTMQRARVPAGLDAKRVQQALVSTLSGSRCTHEHDCCGCATRYVDVRRVGKRDFAVRTTVRYNY